MKKNGNEKDIKQNYVKGSFYDSKNIFRKNNKLSNRIIGK